MRYEVADRYLQHEASHLIHMLILAGAADEKAKELAEANLKATQLLALLSNKGGN